MPANPSDEVLTVVATLAYGSPSKHSRFRTGAPCLMWSRSRRWILTPEAACVTCALRCQPCCTCRDAELRGNENVAQGGVLGHAESSPFAHGRRHRAGALRAREKTRIGFGRATGRWSRFLRSQLPRFVAVR